MTVKKNIMLAPVELKKMTPVEADEKAMQLLPKDPNIGKYNRIDYYAAEGLLAKVYLTKAGLSGQLNRDDLTKAAQYAQDVIKNSGPGTC